MKFQFNPTNEETEVIVNGKLDTPETKAILDFLNHFKPSSRIFLYDEEKIIPVDISDIFYFEVINRKCYAHLKDNVYECKLKLYEADELLDFVQIAKSVVVNLNYIDYITPEFSGNFSLFLKGKSDILTLSRKFTANVLNRLKGETSC